jgi:putative acetyltransferase
MAQSAPKPALRPYLPADAPTLAEIFRAGVENLTGDDYDEAQQAAWIATADDEDAFGARLAQNLTLVATLAGSPVGFASLKGPDHIDLLYVHPTAAGQGVATALIDALERLGQARGAKRLTVDASDTARPFFERRGYTAQRRGTFMLGGEWLGNTTMEKRLTP